MCAMVYSNNRAMRESMPQTVPSVGASPPPCDYSHFAADSFDLSLLPSTDCEVPYSPTNIYQLMALFYDPTNSPPPMFHSSLQDEAFFQDFETANPFKVYITMDKSDNRPGPSSPPAYPYPPNPCPVKEEPYSAYMLGSSAPSTPSCYAPLSASPTPLSPAASTTSSTCTFSTQASPHRQRSSPSPMHTNIMIKQEQTIDIQEILKESKLLQESLDSFDSNVRTSSQGASGDQASSPVTIKTEMNPLTRSCIKEEPTSLGADCGGKPIEGERSSDHQLLREVLRDTSFQRKFNLKPFDFAGALATGFIGSEGASTSTAQDVKMEETEAPRSGDVLMSDVALSREKIEPVLSLAIEQLRKDVNNTCSVLGIASDPAQWSVDDVKAWLLWTLRQYSLPLIQIEYFNMDGAALSGLSEEEFQRRAPQCGSTLHAQLEIWKAASVELETHLDMGDAMLWDKSNKSTSSSGEPSEDEEEETEPVVPAGGGKATGSTRGGSHIHLWQFLKELLASPQMHGSCIRWLERSKGVFKIEDSVRVARLWGKRKNRPAMNYDKLSRSIRQYYKKGIMKKTERSQRLVYQFCHPYCL